MGNYFFVVPSLPPLSLKEKPELSFAELMQRLSVNLSKADLEKTKVLRRLVDIYNIRALLLEEPIDPRGNLSEKELDEALLVRASLPEYVFAFLEPFEKVTEKLKAFSGLLAAYFNAEIAKQKGFLRKLLQFERECRLVLVALRAKQLGRDLVKELQFEDPYDSFVAAILAQKDADRYDPPAEYQELKELIASSYPDPWEENLAFAQYRFRKIEEMAEGNHFSLDQVLAYMAKLMILENILELDAAKGKMILDTFKTG